jgi:hypothetical protein
MQIECHEGSQLPNSSAPAEGAVLLHIVPPPARRTRATGTRAWAMLHVLRGKARLVRLGSRRPTT